MNEIKVNRWIGFIPGSKCEIYGFADASEIGYGACVYLKVTNESSLSSSVINLIQDKSKVTPIKPILTTPKLELCAALLLARLTVKVLKALKTQSVNVCLFLILLTYFIG